MKHLLILFVLIVFMTNLRGQGQGIYTISSSGSSIESKNLVVSWTIGEDLIDFTIMDASMRQSSDFKPSLMEMKDGTQLKVFPNITKGLINVEAICSEPPKLKIELIDIKGSKLKELEMEVYSLSIDLSDYAEGGYYLKISNLSLPDIVTVRITKV